MIKGIAHIALYTSKFEQTIQFYQDVFETKNLGYFQTDRRGCWLQLGKDILEIFESYDLTEGTFKHIAIACDDVDALYSKALQHGALEHVQPKDIVLSLQEEVHARIAFIKGINHEQIELFAQQ